MHLFITGGTGFFGKALLRYWKNNPLAIAKYSKITLLSRNPNRFIQDYGALLNMGNINLHKGDILSPQTLPIDRSITHILHAATDSTLGPQLTPLQRYEQIVNGTRNILDNAVLNHSRRVLLTSSGGVYGPQPSSMAQITEDYNGMPDPMQASNAYSIGKRAAEHLCTLYQDSYGIETVVARCFAFVGQDLPLNVHFAIGNFIRDVLYKDVIVVGGDGSPIRSYLHQNDLAAWLMSMLSDGQAGRAYNVGSDEAISIVDLANLVRDTVAPHKPIHIMNIADPKNKKNLYVPSIERSRVELGLSVKIRLKQAITETIKNIASHN